MYQNHSVIVGNVEVPAAWSNYGSLITLDTIGQRIIYDGTPLYVGQSISYHTVEGTLESITLSRYSETINCRCEFPAGTRDLSPEEIEIPVVSMQMLEERADDFFDALRIGDLVNAEIAEMLAKMAPSLIVRPDYIQVSGVMGTTTDDFYPNTKRKETKTYLTLKQFPNEFPHWRYIGHCIRGDDLHSCVSVAVRSKVS